MANEKFVRERNKYFRQNEYLVGRSVYRTTGQSGVSRFLRCNAVTGRRKNGHDKTNGEASPRHRRTDAMHTFNVEQYYFEKPRETRCFPNWAKETPVSETCRPGKRIEWNIWRETSGCSGSGMFYHLVTSELARYDSGSAALFRRRSLYCRQHFPKKNKRIVWRNYLFISTQTPKVCWIRITASLTTEIYTSRLKRTLSRARWLSWCISIHNNTSIRVWVCYLRTTKEGEGAPGVLLPVALSESTRTDSARIGRGFDVFLKTTIIKCNYLFFFFAFLVLYTFYVYPFTRFGECRPTMLIRRLKILKRQTSASQTSLTYVCQKKNNN